MWFPGFEGRNRDWDLILSLPGLNVLEGRGAGGWQGSVLGCVGVQGPLLLLLALGPCSGCGIRGREIRGAPWSEWDVGCGSRDPFWALLELVEKLLLVLGGKGSHGVGCG